MNHSFIDFHSHTILSDGAFTPWELCILAQEAGIGILSITDHNHAEDLTSLRQAFPALTLIQGAEISCLYTPSQGKTIELHVIGLGFDPNHPKIKDVLARNQPNRQPYVDAILDRLREWGIDLGDYHSLKKLHPNRGHLGRMDIAKLMTDLGYTESVDQAFEEYLGGHGQRKAFVPNTLSYVSLEEAVDAIVSAGGVAVLAHLYYYLLDDAQNHKLLRYFKQLTGNRGGMEVYYSLYDWQQRMELKKLADQYNLMYSAASDFHGQNQKENIFNQFEASSCSQLLQALGLAEVNVCF
jgi:predicted metal-dependent phosphoesterase TrpH